MGMRITTDENDDLSEIEDEQDDDDDDDEEGYDDEDFEEDEEEEAFDEEDHDEEAEAEENEKIITALSSGDKKLKMDKLGNYILDE